jgi:hypothetical protein
MKYEVSRSATSSRDLCRGYMTFCGYAAGQSEANGIPKRLPNRDQIGIRLGKGRQIGIRLGKGRQIGIRLDFKILSGG